MQEKIIFKCGGCGARLRISKKYVGARVRCPNCKSVVYIRGKVEQPVQIKPSKTRMIKTPTIVKREINIAVVVVPAGIIVVLIASLAYFFMFGRDNKSRGSSFPKKERLEVVLKRFKQAWETGSARDVVEFYNIKEDEKQELIKQLLAVFDMYFIKIEDMTIEKENKMAHVEFEMRFIPKIKEAEPERFIKKTRWVLKDSRWLCQEPIHH